MAREQAKCYNFAIPTRIALGIVEIMSKEAVATMREKLKISYFIMSCGNIFPTCVFN